MNIEELAFKNRVKLAYLNEIDLLDIIEFLQEDRKQWINQFAKTHNESVEIQRENKELELELSGYRQAILNNKEMLGLKEKNQELKQKYENAVADYETTMSEKIELERQLETMNNFIKKSGKEFIKYLEDEKNRLAIGCSNIYEESLGHTRLINEDIINKINNILEKYKSIIGDDK